MQTPILRWPGGKRQLLPAILERFPETYNCFHEPFAGGGAVTFAVQPLGGHLSDVNGELINFYKMLKTRPADLVETLLGFALSKEMFLALRTVDRSRDFSGFCPVWRAARYLFINRTCFNGIMRVNADGQLNGSYGKPLNKGKVYATENIFAASDALRAIRIFEASYDKVLEAARAGDFVYFDPPYVSVRPAGDIQYTTDGFNLDHQARLAQLCGKLTKKGVYWMLSNSNVEFIQRLYHQYFIDQLAVQRSICGNGNHRGKTTELLITNYT